ncbi:carboxylic ester hydrolase [Favolaschia claudopus]|uniref:Carboxylic ester hydrolase n=1 Tax=Favolaschia claudopus TaxID=2862362 RepID=A0AAV9ZBI0_9AGAR
MVALGTFLYLLPLLSVEASPTVRLGRTVLTGREIVSVQQEFFGNIPYAEPPVGNLRLRPPVPKFSLRTDSFDAREYGPACLQVGTGLSPAEMSEDCLTLNVLRPAGTTARDRLPVMFWTYGGGFQGGQASTANASLIVAQSVIRGTPIIFINFNYRLGPLGFPQGHEAGASGDVNLGIKDQIAALEWVQRNIGAFGGDKDKVTLFGQSAGSVMMSILFLNPGVIEGLARGAIFESGFQGTAPLFPPSRGEGDWLNFVAGVPSCSSSSSLSSNSTTSTLDCLRSNSTTTASLLQGFALAASLTVNPSAPFPPVLDGAGGLIPELPSVLLGRGWFAKMPFIAGTVLDEGTTFVPPTINSTEQLFASAIALFSPSDSPDVLEESVKKLLELYPDEPALGSPFNTGNETFGLSSQFKRASALVGDTDFQAQRRFWMDTAANAGVLTYGYLFTQPQTTTPPAIGVFHASELLYVYGKPDDTSPSSEQLSRIMTDYWVSFVVNLTPNDGLGVPKPEWRQYTPGDKVLMELNGESLTMIADDYRQEQIAFFNSNPAIWRR